MRKIDAYTFGDSPAAVTLAELLSQDEYSGCSKRVSKKFSDFARVLKFIDQIEDSQLPPPKGGGLNSDIQRKS
jgi:hypothetical protein